MKTLLVAIALAIGLPATAHAQAAPGPAPEAKAKCCCEEMGKPMKCCDKHGDKVGHVEPESDPHAGHDMNH